MLVYRVYKVLIITPLLLLLVSLVFRVTFYWTIPIVEDEPYGGSDIIEGIIFLLLSLSCLAAMIFSAILCFMPKHRELSDILRLFLIATLMPALYFILHPLMPRLM